MTRTLPLRVSFATLLVFAGCSSSSSSTGGADASAASDGATGGDAAARDAGAGNADATGAVGSDASVSGPCNAASGADCTGTNICVLVGSGGGNTIETQCRLPAAAPKQLGEMCSTSLHDCAPGLACIMFTGETGMPACRKVCRPGMDADCTGTGGAPDLVCRGPTTTSFALCTPSTGGCQPFNDTCPAGQTCQSRGLGTMCVAEGTAERGQACTASCKRGSICINLGGGGRCYEPCNPMGGMCSMAGSCVGINGAGGVALPFGICEAACNPADDMCPAGRACGITGNNQTACFNEGPNDVGMACGGMAGGCKKGQVCVNNPAPMMGASCRRACDMTHPCAMGMCSAPLMGFMFGACP